MKASTSVVVLIGLSACSGDAVRFTDNFYTAAIPVRPQADVGPINNVPVATPAQQRAVIAASYPGNTGAYSVAAPAVGSPVDPLATGSVRQPYPSAPVVAAAPTYNGGLPGAVRSQPLPPPAMPGVDRPSNVSGQVAADASRPQLRPADLVDTSRVKTGVDVPAGVDMTTTGSINDTRPLQQAEGWTRAGGTYISVRPGETIFNLAKRYGVPANAILEANNISDPSAIGVGQRILIPTYVYSRNAPVSAPDANANVVRARSTTGTRSEFPVANAPRPQARPGFTSNQVAVTNTVRQPVPASALPVAAPSVPSGRYVVQAGDTLYAISRRTGATVDGIKRVNSMSSNALRVGQRLIIPGVNTATGTAPFNGNSIDPVVTASVPQNRNVAAYTPPQPSSGTSGEVASIDRNDASSAPDTTGVGRLRWPAKGRIITGFRSNDGGVPNEGIDISLPMGTPIKAAENGVVIYAGDGLKELGRTVLVRHEDGLVTVYGHTDKLQVQRGDNVTRGQVLATSGMSGSATKPKLHFEVRKNTKAVDPMTYLN